MRIELVGGLGCGKTTLAKELEKRGAVGVYEELESNPFLESCYKDFDTFKFPSQMWFALTKYHEIGVYDDPNKIYVHDQAVINNNAYTNLMFKDNFDSTPRQIVQDCFNYTEEWFGPPDTIVRIHRSPEAQMENIRNRARQHEQEVDLEFIKNLEEEIEKIVTRERELGYNRIIDIDADDVDFKEDKEFVDNLWETIRHVN